MSTPYPKILPINEFELQSGVKLGTYAAIYGVGIAGAITKQRLGEREKEQQYQTADNLQFPYTPDAVKNDFGGYDKTDRWDGRMSSSLAGMPVMCYLRFIGGTYIDLQGNTLSIPDVVFETVVVTVSLSKNLKQTPITGRDSGSVIEYIGSGNHEVEIRAIITADAPVNDNVQKRNQDGVYPRDNMSEIIKVLQAPVSLKVDCWYLQQFGINYLVINNGTVSEQIEGEYSQQRLIIPAISDSPLILKIGKSA